MLPNEQAALWYVIHTYSGYENKVAANIERMVETRGLENLIFETRIPTEILVDSEEEADEYRKGDDYVDEDDTAETDKGDDYTEDEETAAKKRKAGKPTEHKLFPSYVLVKMIMNDETWHIVRNIRGVTGFVEMPQAGQTACGRICAGDAERGGDAKQQRRKESVHGSSEVSRTKLRNLPRNRNSCGREFAALPAGEEPVSRVLLSGADAECAQIG